MRHVGVLGAGAWGTALSIVAAAGGPVTLLARRPELAERMEAERRNPDYLPDAPLPAGVRVTANLAELADCDALIAVVPAQQSRATLGAAAVGARPLLLCAKGIEAGTLQLPSEVAAEAAPQAAVAVLSGPNFAHEVAAGLPAAATLAAVDPAAAQAWAERLASAAFRPYAAPDLIGAQVGGAVKNVLAVACGAVIGAGLGENARAAVIARGFAEMTRYGLARGGCAETLAGLSGLGDLVLTCGSAQSRNFRLGMALGRGEAPELGRSVAEGAATAPALAAHAQALGIDMPIAAAVAELTEGRAAFAAVAERLLRRPLRAES